MNYHNIIWDWNGTLLNDIELCVNIANQILTNHNDTILTIEHYKSVFGFPITSYYEKIGVDFEKESFELLTKKFISNYNSNVKSCNLHPNVIDMLQILQKENLNQFILTAAYKKDALHLLEHYEIRHFFKSIEGLDNYKAASKIDKGHQLLKDNAIDKTKTVLIGDTIHDLEVANALGVNCILVAHGHQSKERLQAKADDATLVIDNLDFIENIMLQA